jgi:hypothetical protein
MTSVNRSFIEGKIGVDLDILILLNKLIKGLDSLPGAPLFSTVPV